jgi:hypothetical protein
MEQKAAATEARLKLLESQAAAKSQGWGLCLGSTPELAGCEKFQESKDIGKFPDNWQSRADWT